MITKGHQGVRRWKFQFRWPHLLFCGIRLRFHFILHWNHGGFLGMNDSLRWIILRTPWIQDWLQWMSTFLNCGKSMKNKEPSGLYPLKYLFHLDLTFRWFSTIQFSLSVMSDSLRPHESQHSRYPCPSPTPGVHSNSCPLSWWCHPAISSSIVPFSSCPQSLPASGSFPIWVNSSHEVAKVLEFQLQDQSFQRTLRTGLL